VQHVAEDGSARRDLVDGETATNTVSIAIDGDADAALAAQRTASSKELRCDACDAPVEGEPSGRGLYMWTRGDEVRFEEPALCSKCATAIGVTALQQWTVEEEEG
jgi:hypothetical protein